jgi:ATP-binding protein involved in chromosome partitioning
MVQIQDSVPRDPDKEQAQKDAAIKQSLGKIKNKILVMSGKGGVGKTSTSVNLSIALASSGYKVGIMDVDLHGPDVPRMLGLEGMPQLTPNHKLSPMRKRRCDYMARSFKIFGHQAIHWRRRMGRA